MQVQDKATQFKQSVHRSVDNMLKSIPNLHGAFNGFHGSAWSALKSPDVLLLPTFADKHARAYKQMVDTCSYFYSNNDFFNMCIRMAEIGAMKSGAEHQLAQAKRLAVMNGFVRVRDSILFSEDVQSVWSSITHTVAKKNKGYEDHLVPITDMVESCKALGLLINESYTMIAKATGVTELVEDMVKYYEKINEAAEEAILA